MIKAIGAMRSALRARKRQQETLTARLKEKKPATTQTNEREPDQRSNDGDRA